MEKLILKICSFFNNNDVSTKDMINIVVVEYDNMKPLFCVMKKDKTHYVVKEIFRDGAIVIFKQYSNLVF